MNLHQALLLTDNDGATYLLPDASISVTKFSPDMAPGHDLHGLQAMVTQPAPERRHGFTIIDTIDADTEDELLAQLQAHGYPISDDGWTPDMLATPQRRGDVTAFLLMRIAHGWTQIRQEVAEVVDASGQLVDVLRQSNAPADMIADVQRTTTELQQAMANTTDLNPHREAVQRAYHIALRWLSDRLNIPLDDIL